MVVMSKDSERSAREGWARRIQPITSSPVFGTLDSLAPEGVPAVTARAPPPQAPATVADRPRRASRAKRLLHMTKDTAGAIIYGMNPLWKLDVSLIALSALAKLIH